MSALPYVIDLHAHYPMQFDDAAEEGNHPIRHAHERETFGDRIRFGILQLADRFLNRRDPLAPHAVTLDTLRAGHVGAALSAAYCPFTEMDLRVHYAAEPKNEYFRALSDLLAEVEKHVEADPHATMVRDPASLHAALAAKKLAMIHAVEGGLQLGDDDATIAANVKTLAELGCAYITVCHLFWRQVGTNAPALPFLRDEIYERLFPQPATGLQHRGRALITSMLRNGVLIDVAHMSEASMMETFDLLDAADPHKTVPVIASHIACRIGNLQYNLSQRWVEKIAERKGVAGIIYCDHFIRDDAHGAVTASIDQTWEKLEKQIETMRSWGGDDILAIGSDLDGFIKPTLKGLESASSHKLVAKWLVGKYGEPLARKICHENALRVLDARWRKPYP